MLKLKSDVAKRGYQIYRKLRKTLEREHLGEYVAIELKSENYFLGQDMGEALEKAEQKYPNEEFFVVRVGELATASFKHRFTL